MWHTRPLKITWVTRSFLDYRVPVFKEVDSLCNKNLHVLYSNRWCPVRVQKKLARCLGERSMALSGEKSIGDDVPVEANKMVCFAYQPGLLQAIDRTDPDILIGDGFFQWTALALVYKLWKKVPMVVCYERTFHTERNAQWYRLLYRRVALKFVDAVCCNGRLCVEYTKWLGMPESRITTGHMVADMDGLRLQVNQTTPERQGMLRRNWAVEGLVFIFVGRLIKTKGVKQLLTAWDLFERSMPGAGTLVIIGRGPDESRLQRLKTGLGLNGVRFLGYVDYDQIATYYTSADVFIMPTLEDNWSLAVPEAMACGLPVLTSKYNGCWPELVHSGVNGWTFDSLDPEDILRCLRLCVKHAFELKEMGRRSKEIVSEHSPQRAAQSILRACEIGLTRIRSKR